MLLALSFGAGQALNASNASSERKAAFSENPVASVTIPDVTPTTSAASPDTTTPSLGEFANSTTTTGAAAPTATTSPIAGVCTFAAKIVASALPGPLGIGPADEFDMTVTKASWANKMITYEVEYALPAKVRLVTIAMPVAAVADKNGTAHFSIPIGPESQGGVVSLLSEVRSDVTDTCAHAFTIDYNGAQGLVGGLVKSSTNLVNGLLGQ